MNSPKQRDDVRLIDCTEAEHAAAILEILNDAIANSTALYDYLPRPPEAMVTWFATKRAGGFPVVGAVDASGTLLGFASWGTFRAFPAYKYTVEHSVYVHRDQRGRGLGELLLREVVRRAREAQVHVLVGCIDATNAGSIALHTKLGFVHSGTITEAGFKFGRWLDAAFYQLKLDTPAQPVDG
ncbi:MULTISPECIES: GNAT family N-acetyltransferase [Burkholderia cepacia complex]|uniref:GNAT family N-acetyltransferase n=1 Tax=Burkholderia cepacia complex TaxID=87882 RepID=UPI00157B395D|nr:MULTISPECIES: GNAT family N-acetyltransferase [Burkholderia cepacia complex]NTY36057.1 N-acetyltransferase family protein [Burkholderia diffusa]